MGLTNNLSTRFFKFWGLHVARHDLKNATSDGGAVLNTGRFLQSMVLFRLFKKVLLGTDLPRGGGGDTYVHTETLFF